MYSKKPILVTGSHRSGSTWVGRMLSLSKDTAFIWEPLNMTTSKGIMREEIPFWFLHINDNSGKKYYSPLKDTLNFKFSYIAELKNIREPKQLARFIRDGYRFKKYKSKGLRAVIKDPIALMSAEWLSKTFDMDVIVLIRNPFAFCVSLLRLKSEFPFSDFLEQPDLMDLYLIEFKDEIIEFTNNKKSILEQGVLLWKIIHYVIMQYQIKYPQWGYYRHEDLSRDPINEFKRMYKYAGLNYTSDIEKKICVSTGMIAPSYRDSDKLLLITNSKENLHSWKKHLSEKDASYVYNKTEKYLKHFYPDIDFIL